MLGYALHILFGLSVLYLIIIALFGGTCVRIEVNLLCEELTEMVVCRWIGMNGETFSSSTQVATWKTL